MDKLVKATLRKASRKSVEEVLPQLKRYFKLNKWLGNNNRYLVNVTKLLFEDTQPGRAIKHRHLAQYIAASAPLHCADGWSLLGRSIDCHSRGDTDAARHFAYYAELRAAMSLLAVEGVGIFSDRHFVVRTPTDCPHIGSLPRAGRRGGLPTHSIVWSALNHWADLKRSTELLGEMISAGGLSVAEWLEHFQTGPSFQPIGSQWLKTWGLDLRRMSDDRDARNDASYRPTHLVPRGLPEATATVDFICALWSSCEPSSYSRFENLDRHLLRLTLEKAFEGTKGSTPIQDPAAFLNNVSLMLDHANFEGPIRQEWLDFLTRKTEPQNPAIIIASQRLEDIHDINYHTQVLSRAPLLLRVATGACARLLQRTDLKKEDLKFWWLPLGQERGLWDAGFEPDQMTDLWADVDTAVEEVKSWEGANAAQKPSLERWRRELPYQISVLGGFERVALWGLGL